MGKGDEEDPIASARAWLPKSTGSDRLHFSCFGPLPLVCEYVGISLFGFRGNRSLLDPFFSGVVKQMEGLRQGHKR